MNKSSLLLITLAMTTWTWLRQPAGTLADCLRTRLDLPEEEALRALAWLRTELHNLQLAPPGVADATLEPVEQEPQLVQALCDALDAVPAVHLWVDDAVVDGTPRLVDFPLSPALERLATRLVARPEARRTPARPARGSRVPRPEAAPRTPAQPKPARPTLLLVPPARNADAGVRRGR